MNKYSLIAIFLIAIIIIGCSSQKKDRSAQGQLSRDIEITQSWARPAAAGANSAAYLTIHNNSAENDTLIQVESDIAGNAEVHQSYTTEDGLSGMRPAGTIIIPRGDSLMLQPGGFHIMLMNLSKQLAVDDSLPLQLHFARSGFEKISVPVHN